MARTTPYTALQLLQTCSVGNSMNASALQASPGPGCYSAPNTAPGQYRPSPAFQDKQDRFDRPLQSMVPPVLAHVLLPSAPCPAAPSPWVLSNSPWPNPLLALWS